MRVVFLCKHGIRGPSSRYRVHQLVPGLRARGVTCVVRPFVPDRLFPLYQRPGKTFLKILATLRCIAGRVGHVLHCVRADVVVVQREVCPVGPPVFEWIVACLRKPLLCDFDDATYEYKANRFTTWGNALRSTGRFRFLARRAHIVTVANPHLQERARAHNKDVRYLREVEDTERIRPPASGLQSGPARDPLVLGWIGSPSTVKYLRLIEGPLRRVMASRRVALRLVGAPWPDAPFPVEFVPWTLASEADALRGFDIGLMPVPDDEWGRGKSGCKARQYMAAGVPPVASPVGFNTELIRAGETGCLPGDLEAWHDDLLRLIDDPGLRRRLGAAARTHVVVQYGLARGVEELHAVLHDARGGGA